ncbi:hypothetical protein [Lunatibacter salilacus]|uniref:hypothetical protein n=1 Tax=Lunatibacter salilacus TaxID=2483804 RepID=UPI00131D7C0C|nr:hypothetical protein [Lunatibacter salilacus]
MDEKINMKEPLNLALFYVLFNCLAELLDLGKDKPDKWVPDHFVKKINGDSKNKIKGYIKESDVGRLRVDNNLMKNVFPRLQRNPLKDNSSYTYKFKKSSLNRFCKIIKYSENIDYTWDNFKLDYTDVAETLLLKHPRKFVSTGLVGKAKVCLGFNYFGFSQMEQLKKEISEAIEIRMYSVFDSKEIEIVFWKENEKIKALDQASEIGTQMGVDLMIYANTFYNDPSGIQIEFNYVITNSIYLERFSSDNLLISAEGKSDFLNTDLQLLFSGHLQGNIDLVLNLLMALKFYLENHSEKALNYLIKITDEARCEEIWFLIGVCKYDLEDYDGAKLSWEKAREINSKHLKARKNLAILLLEEYRSPENSHKSDHIKENILELVKVDMFIQGPKEYYLSLAIIFDELEEPFLAEEFFTAFIKGPALPGKDYSYLRLSDLPNGKISHVEQAAKISRNIDIQIECAQKIVEATMDPKDKLKTLKSILKSISERKEISSEKRAILHLYNTQIEYFESNLGKINFKGGKETKLKGDIPLSDNLSNTEILLEQSTGENPVPLESDLKEGSIFDKYKSNYLRISRRKSSANSAYLFLDSLILKHSDLVDSPFLRINFEKKDRCLEIPSISEGCFEITSVQLIPLLEGEDKDFYLDIQNSIYHQNKIHFFKWKIIKVYMPDIGEFRQEIHEFAAKLENLHNEEKLEAIYSHIRNSFGIIDFQLLQQWLVKERIIKIS